MDQILSILVSWQFIVLCLGIFAVIQFIRIIVEYTIPSSINARWWRSFILPLLPLILGALVGFFTKKYNFAFPDVITTNAEKFMFSIGAGALSSTVVRVIREMLLNRNAVNTYQPYPINPFSPDPNSQISPPISSPIQSPPNPVISTPSIPLPYPRTLPSDDGDKSSK